MIGRVKVRNLSRSYALSKSFLDSIKTSMNFPYGTVQPSQETALNLLAAFTPECLPQLMFDHADTQGTPLHDRYYRGHKMDVWDVGLKTFIKYELEHPRHCEVEEIPQGKSSLQT